MASKIIKNIIAISWISVVIFFYFQNHNYYLEGWYEAGKWLLPILLLPICYGCYTLYQWFEKEETKIKIRITTPKILAIFFILLLIIGNATFLIRSVSLYTGESLFYSNTTGELAMITDLSTISEDQDLIIAKNNAFTNTSESFETWVPAELQSFFIKPTFLDIQFGLITKSIGILLGLGFIVLISISIGLTTKRKIIPDDDDETSSLLISLGIGLFEIATSLFLLGALHIITIYTTWGLFILLGLISRKTFLELIKKIAKFKYNYEGKIFNFNLLIVYILAITWIANFIDNISPMPRGWDGMNQYVNIAKRIEEANGLIQMGGNYFWELIMSLGFTMFKWTTMTLNLASFLPATIATIAIYLVAKKFLSTKTALTITSFLYITPLYLFHGVEDNKIDVGVLSISVITCLAIYKAFKTKNKKEKYSYFAIAGLMAGFCFGIKITSMILILSLLTIILLKNFKKTGLIAGILSSTGLIIVSGTAYVLQDLPITESTFKAIGAILFISGILLLTQKIVREKKYKALIGATLFLVFSVVAFSPWMIKNFSENKSISINGLTFGAHPSPVIDWELMEEEYNLDTSLCTNTGTNEELNRYLGYQSPINKYLTLPWHLTMNDQGTVGIYIDFGWTLLALLPALLLFIPLRKKSWRWQATGWFTAVYWLLWTITANGIIWYGLPGFLGILLIIGGLIENYEKDNNFHKKIITIVILIFLITSLGFRLSQTGKGTLLLYTANLFEEEEATLGIFPSSKEVHDLFEADQDGINDLIWKVGTNLNYFIEDNFWRTYNDQYLDDFNCLYIERDPELLTTRLKALNFGYIAFDYYTYSLSPDPEGTLWNKYEAALDYLLNYTNIVIPDYYRGHIVAEIR